MLIIIYIFGFVAADGYYVRIPIMLLCLQILFEFAKYVLIQSFIMQTIN